MRGAKNGERGAGRSLAWRLAGAFAVVFVSLVVVSVACTWALVDIHHRLHAVKAEEEKARGILRLASAVRDQYAHVAHTIIIGNDTHAGFFDESSRTLRTFAAQARARDMATATTAIVEGILRDSDEIERLFRNDVLPAVRAARSHALVDVHERILRRAMRAQDAAEELAAKAEGRMDDLGKHVAATQHGAVAVTLIAHLIALLSAAIVGVYLHRSVARPIATLSSAVGRVGAGELDTIIPVEREDEIGVLAQRFNEMTRSLKDHHARLLQTEKLAGLGRMAAGIAHELNNPVAVILGYAKLLQRTSAPADPKTLKAIEEEAERCHQVIEGLLQLTRDGAVNAQPLSVRPIVTEVAERVRVTLGSSSARVEIVGDVDARADEPKLRQILTNLICNAFEASPPEGTVVVQLERDGKWAVVRVVDAGPGVKADDRDRIFEPFFTTKASGTGLGLAISRAIARAHGGDLTLTQSSRGVTFALTLPASGGGPR